MCLLRGILGFLLKVRNGKITPSFIFIPPAWPLTPSYKRFLDQGQKKMTFFVSDLILKGKGVKVLFENFV